MSSNLITVRDLQGDLQCVASKWDMLGIHLSIPKDILDSIKVDVSNGASSKTESCFYKVIEAWLYGPNDKITVDVLAEAVKMAGYGALARSLLSERHSLTLDLKTVTARLKDCKSKYTTLGLHLGLDFSMIQEFETSKGDSVRCLMHMLNYYVNNKEPSVREICEAVEMVGRRDVSTSLSQKYKYRSF